jgi:hypothetical protein
MTAEQFAYWLQGFAELNAVPPTPEQWKSINEHLQTVFAKVTPAYVPPSFGFPGHGIRTLELRPSDIFNPPVITC